MTADASFCLFRCETLPLAVPVANVAEVVPIDAIVRIGLCPPWIAGLCPYHREVVPVVALDPARQPAEAAQAEKRPPSKDTRDAVLILETEQGLWGLRIDRDRTAIALERPTWHEPRQGEDGVVTAGLVHHCGIEHALLDTEATWRGLRESIVHWYARIDESAAASASRLGRRDHGLAAPATN